MNGNIPRKTTDGRARLRNKRNVRRHGMSHKPGTIRKAGKTNA